VFNHQDYQELSINILILTNCVNLQKKLTKSSSFVKYYQKMDVADAHAGRLLVKDDVALRCQKLFADFLEE